MLSLIVTKICFYINILSTLVLANARKKSTELKVRSTELVKKEELEGEGIEQKELTNIIII